MPQKNPILQFSTGKRAVFHRCQLRKIIFRLIARMILDLVLPDKSERADTAQDSQNQKLGQRQNQHY